MAKRGPKTEEGRAAVRMNAWKHGISSADIVNPIWEDESEWLAHLEGIVDSLQPEGRLEYKIVERIAIAFWKLDRVEAVNMFNIYDHQRDVPRHIQIAEAYAQGTISRGEFSEPDEDEVKFRQLGRLLGREGDLKLTTRYEAHLHRLIMQNLHELEALQARRNGRNIPLARFDVNRAPESDL
jgi:hypothetical protein